MATDEVQALELLDGALPVVAGFLLLLPGFLTDVLGLLFLLPAVRQWMIRRYLRLVPVRGVRTGTGHPDSRVIEGRFRRED